MGLSSARPLNLNNRRRRLCRRRSVRRGTVAGLLVIYYIFITYTEALRVASFSCVRPVMPLVISPQVYKSDTPSHVIIFLINLGNMFNAEAARTTNIEKWRSTPQIESGWKKKAPCSSCCHCTHFPVNTLYPPTPQSTPSIHPLSSSVVSAP